MNESLSWKVVRGLPQHTFNDCLERAEDLGRRGHIEKVLLETFKGSTSDGGVVTWRGKGFILQFALGTEARPRLISVEVLLGGLDPEALIAALSTKCRGQLERRRFWRFFDARTHSPIRWNPPRKKALGTKGLVTIGLDSQSLLKHLAYGPGVMLLVGLEGAADIEGFMDSVPLLPSHDVVFGWKNVEVATPRGNRLFLFHFGGPGREEARRLVRRLATEAGRATGIVKDDRLIVEGPLPELVPVAACKGDLHNVWESSLQSGSPSWREAFRSYRPS